MRRYNERLVLSTVRRLRGASKADIAKLTGLSPQAAVRIVESLEEAGRLVRGGRRTGGMGQPAMIYQINENSGCTIGVEIARDRLTCVLMNFDGTVLSSFSEDYDFPRPDDVVAKIASFSSAELAKLSKDQRNGFLGTGIAIPWFLREWNEELGVPGSAGEKWQGTIVAKHFRERIGGPIFFENDGNAGALAELFCGSGQVFKNFLYVHVGRVVGGGLVLGGQLHQGLHGNAAALASMPVPGPTGFDVMLHQASLYLADEWHRDAIDDSKVDAWLTTCANALGFMAIGANSLLDLEGLIIGGTLAGELLDALIERVNDYMADHAPKDFFHPTLTKGSIGEIAPAQGAGLLPLFSTFSPDLDSLLK